MKDHIKGYTTRSLHTPFPRPDVHNALNFPVYDSVAFDFESSTDIEDAFNDRRKAHTYSRVTNPTVEYLEEKIRNITGSHGVVAMSSGMAAITSVFLSLVDPGENIVSSPRLFAHSHGLLEKTLGRLGIECRFVNMLDLAALDNTMDDRTRVVFFETVTNPQLEIADIASISELTRKKNVVLVTDSTVTPMNIFSGGKLGVNLEVMSSTKFISGGATSVGGVVIDHGNYAWDLNPSMRPFYEKYGENAFLARQRKEIFRTLGPSLSPHAAWYQIMGLDIMDLRVERCHGNCLKIASFMKDHPGINEVNYPGLKDNPFHDLAIAQFKGIPGTVMTFDLESGKECFDFMDRLQVIRRATNLNDNKTLIIHPWSTIYAEYSHEAKTSMGLRDSMLRLSVGIEDAEDLINDIAQALA